ncbi:hypothetical protein SARC_02890 [Sphaeroforma arctica JP610]|uniref:Uncharacterized protein n=1 Tax=Sphaeroforma arctica JP610 TaxID=667725 RepID=A0A0L0G9H1_9EUKA|nr:hypothetical protein SARC_02890 [Sphaeroforma arctica JP610]KNC84908.1 hypothetical protein SARC_02890 [Sphaeroforma arctica JP610]|eukprot:XP_014158810.1 hypothetical protein SARC_02890 [Sphaeroforma arctica JP610]
MGVCIALLTLALAADASPAAGEVSEVVDNRHKDIYNMTYGEVAKARVWPEFQNLHASTNEWLLKPDTEINPDNNELKHYRKALEATRDYFDLFAFAYPYEVMEGQDAYRMIHKHIKNIHHDTGEMKDGRRMAIGEEEERILRDKISDELTAFSKGMNTTRWQKYLSRPLEHRMYRRSHYELSAIFWQSMPDEIPSETLTGMQNIAAMNQVYMRTAANNWIAVKDWSVEDLGRRFVEVHDVRKLVRAFNFTQGFFPEIWKDPAEGKALMVEALDFYDHYTQLKNPLELYTHFRSKGKTDKANEQKGLMNEQWIKLTQWQQSLPKKKRFSQLCEQMVNSMIDVPEVKVDSGLPSWAWGLISLFVVLAAGAMVIGCYKSVQSDWSRGGGYESIE